MRASDLMPREYKNFPEFKEFGIDLSLVSPYLILELQKFREFCGIPLIPSPAAGAWGRTEEGSENSRHYAVGRLSDAGDLFIREGLERELWLCAVQWEAFGGVGLYTETHLFNEPAVMVHLDLRPYRGQKALWVRNGDIYHGPSSPVFWETLKNL